MEPRHFPRPSVVSLTAVAAAVTLTGGTASAADDPSSIPASAPQHFINFSYGMPENFTTFRYSIKVDTDSNEDDIYYAHYLYGNQEGTGFYSGLQPHLDGTAGVRFSFFGDGAQPQDPHCEGGADGGVGVTCAVDDLSYAAGHSYTFEIVKSDDGGSLRYTGTITDDQTRAKRTIGSWSLASDFPGFSDSANAFVEKFDGISTCGDIPSVKASYRDVTADGNAVPFKPIEHDATDEPGEGIYTCTNVSDYTVAPSGGGYDLTSSVSG